LGDRKRCIFLTITNKKGGLCMRPNRLKILLVFFALLMFAFTGELAAQEIHFGTHTDTVYYNVEIQLAAALDTGAGSLNNPDETVLFSVISGDGSVNPGSDLTDSYGVALTTFTAGTTEGVVYVEARWEGPTDTLTDTTSIQVQPAPTTLTITPTGRSIVTGEDLTLTATLDGVMGGDTIRFTVLGNGAAIPSDTVTNASGVTTTTFAAPSSAELDTVIGTWDDGFNAPVADTVFINIVNAPTQVTLSPGSATLALNGSQAFQARVVRSGVGVGGLMVDFSLIPGLGSVDPDSGISNGSGYVNTTYTASTTAGTDTLIVSWTDEDLRLTLADTSIITINPGAATSLNVTPGDTVVVVTEDATITVELLDDFLNHVDATSGGQVSFATSGHGTFGTAAINDGLIEVAYTTDDSMATDVITTELLVNHTRDYDTVNTIGGAPAHMQLYPVDTIMVVGGNNVYFSIWLFDQYWNQTMWSDYYGGETHVVNLSVSEGGGIFTKWSGPIDTTSVNPYGGYTPGAAEVWYLSSNTVGVYAITGTSGDATESFDMHQICDYPDSLFLTGDSIGIPSGSDTLLTAMLFDQYGNFCPADDSRGFEDVYWDVLDGNGWLEEEYIDENDHNWKARFHSYEFDADTSHVIAAYDDDDPSDVITIFSAEPGDLDHFDITLFDIEGEVFDDRAYVSDGSDLDTAYINAVTIEAQDGNNIRLWTYNNPDTLTLTLNGSSAGASQVIWYILNLGVLQPPMDTVVGLTAPIPPGYFYQGMSALAVTNQVAETVTITATDTAGHTGTSPELTWLPTEVVGFDVALEGGLTTITAIDDTVNMEVTAIDEFGNTTGMGLPLNVILSATRPVSFLGGEMQLLENPVSLFPMVATQEASDLVLRIADYLVPSINGSSDPITVNPSGIEGNPIITGISARFGSGEISYAVAEAGRVTIKVYNKVGMQVGSLVDGAVSPGYYQASLKGLGLSSDIYFVVMQGPGVNKKIKATLIK
jgi:hypothetical protein